MPLFRKNPTIIEANQYLGDGKHVPGVCACSEHNGAAHVHTAHNNQSVVLEIGDWVLPEPNGVNYYPVKAEIFANTFEAVDQEPKQAAAAVAIMGLLIWKTEGML